MLLFTFFSFYMGIFILILMLVIIPFVTFSMANETIAEQKQEVSALPLKVKFRIYLKSLRNAIIIAGLVGGILWLAVYILNR